MSAGMTMFIADRRLSVVSPERAQSRRSRLTRWQRSARLYSSGWSDRRMVSRLVFSADVVQRLERVRHVLGVVRRERRPRLHAAGWAAAAAGGVQRVAEDELALRLHILRLGAGLVEVYERWRASITRGWRRASAATLRACRSYRRCAGPRGGCRSTAAEERQLDQRTELLTCFIRSARCACDSRCAARSIFCARFLLEPPEVESRLLPPKSREKNPPFCIAFRLFARCM